MARQFPAEAPCACCQQVRKGLFGTGAAGSVDQSLPLEFAMHSYLR